MVGTTLKWTIESAPPPSSRKVAASALPIGGLIKSKTPQAEAPGLPILEKGSGLIARHKIAINGLLSDFDFDVGLWHTKSR